MIGTGNVTERKSGPAFSKIPGSKLVAVGNRTPAKAEDYAKRHGIQTCHSDPYDVIKDPEVDCVYIATPPQSHPDYALACIRAGKPVYIEKPMARNYEECRVINEAAENAGVPVYVAFYRRSLDYFLKIKEILEEKRLGKILHINMQQYFSAREEELNPSKPPWRVIPEISGGGNFHDMGCHALDIIFYLFGDPAACKRKFFEHRWTLQGRRHCGCGHYPARTDTVTGSWSFISPPSLVKDRVVITGEKGQLSFSIFSFEPISLSLNGKEDLIGITPPEHIQMPLIQSIVNELNGMGSCPSTGKTGAVCSRVMDQICS